MPEMVTENMDNERQLWRDQAIKLAKGFFFEWLSMARVLNDYWGAFVHDETKEILEGDPKTEERFRKEKLGVKDERCWQLLMDLVRLTGELHIEQAKQDELTKRVQQRPGFKFDRTLDIVTLAKLVREDIRDELPGARVSIKKGGLRQGCKGSVTATVKDLGPYEQEELWDAIDAIVQRYNILHHCHRLELELDIIYDLEYAWNRAVAEWERDGKPIPEGLQMARYEVVKLEKAKMEKRMARERKKAESAAISRGLA